MRPWTIPILGIVALSLAIPSGAEARLRFGPGVVLGAVTGVMFGGFRHSSRHHHRRHAVHALARPRRVARWERRLAASTPRPQVSTPPSPTNPPSQPSASPEQTAAIFWPDAAADLADFMLFPNGKGRFWTYGYDSIVNATFTDADSGGPPGMNGRLDGGRLRDASSQAKTPLASADLCGVNSASADALIERIERAVGPNASQRDALEQLRRALAQAIERIATACPAAMPTTVAERLKAIQDRIWAMHDALLTMRLPFESFYNSLTDEQREHLRREEPGSAEVAASATEGGGQTLADRRSPTCAEPAAGSADLIMRAIGRAARPSEEERAGLEALRLRSDGIAQLIAGSCPSDAKLDPIGRFAAAKDRLDLMLFAVMSMSPALQQLYDSLDDKQKAGLARALRQVRRSGATRRVVSQTPDRTQRVAADICTSQASALTDWPIERVTEVVQPTDAQRALLDEFRVANAKAIGILQGACMHELPSIPTGRLAAMKNRLQVMLSAVQTVRPALDRLYQSLIDEQKARFNAVAPASDAAAGQDQGNLTTLCDQRTPGVTDLPIDRLAEAVRPTSAQQASLDELKDASLTAAEGLKANCPSYQALTPTGRVEAMEKRLDAMLAAVKIVQPALTKFYDGLSDEQKARFNTLRSATGQGQRDGVSHQSYRRADQK
jgi:LTXXQ motif family protein